MTERAYIDQLVALASDARADFADPQLAPLFAALRAQPTQCRADGLARLAAAAEDPALSDEVRAYAAMRLAALEG
jgi:hypothetical protein